MAYNDISKKATNTYRAKFDIIQIRVPLGDRAKISAYADAHGESMNAFISRILKETMDMDPQTPKIIQAIKKG